MARAQESGPVQDVIYLHNGSVIRGKILQQTPGDSVTIQILPGRILTFSTREVEAITMEEDFEEKALIQYRRTRRPVVMKSTGLYHRFSVGLGLGQGRWGVQGNGSLGYHIGYIVKPRLRVGLASGFDFYNGGVITPVMAEAQADLVFKKVTPVARVQLGYGFGISSGWANEVFRGGPVGQVALGFRFRTRTRFEWMLTGGFKAQQTYQEFMDWPPGQITAGGIWVQPDPGLVTGTRRYQRTFIELGIGF
ncbi:MAG: hypothetical protein D6722_00245 [Bacteroidetes bacterium]|nr:MAG: hypothetical protein D6722_00245 [Bacteroidota bacterium]